jgi:hypothetical protein
LLIDAIIPRKVRRAHPAEAAKEKVGRTTPPFEMPAIGSQLPGSPSCRMSSIHQYSVSHASQEVSENQHLIPDEGPLLEIEPFGVRKTGCPERTARFPHKCHAGFQINSVQALALG